MAKTGKKKVPYTGAPNPKRQIDRGDVIVLPDVDPETKETFVDLFERDGKMYRIPSRPQLGVALAFLRITAQKGENAGAYYLLSTVLGPEGYDALETYPGLTNDILEGVLKRAQSVVMGGLELPKP